MMVTFVFVMIMIAGASTDRIVEVLNEIPEMRDPADAVTSVADGDIIFDHVSFSYAGEGGNLSLKTSICISNPVRPWGSSVEPEVQNQRLYS